MWVIDEGVLDTEFDLTPGGRLWQDQPIFFKIANAAIMFNFESGEGFTFCAAEKEETGKNANRSTHRVRRN